MFTVLTMVCAACSATTSTVALEQTVEPVVEETEPQNAEPEVLIFERQVGDALQIFVSDARGENERQLTDAAVGSGQSSLTADGTKVVFVRDEDLFVIDIDGGGLEQLTDNDVFEAFPNLSPDGSQLVFTRASGALAEILLLDLTTGEERTLVGNASAFAPVWSPDGTRIAFHGDLVTPSENSALFVVGIDVGTPEQITDFDESRFATWSPDGSRLAFHRISTTDVDQAGRFARDIWLVDIATGDEELLVDHPDLDRSPSWSASSNQIAFFRDGPATNDLEIMVVDPTSGEVTSTAISGSQPNW